MLFIHLTSVGLVKGIEVYFKGLIYVLEIPHYVVVCSNMQVAILLVEEGVYMPTFNFTK